MVSFILPGNSATGGYEVDNSLRFNDGDSAYLNRTQGTPTNADKFTLSVWVKRCGLTTSDYHYIASFDGGSNPREHIRFNDTTDELTWYFRDSGGTATSLTTNRLFRDVSAWYHIVCSYDSTQSTSSNRQKIYVNGVQETSFSSSGYVAQNTDSNLNTNSNNIKIGALGVSSPSAGFFDGYMAEYVFIDGQSLDPTSFGEFDSDSPTIWRPIDVSGLTFGTNGFYLDFEDSGNLGNDANGGTDFTANNLAATDQSTDNCTNNFATMNPLDNSVSAGTFSEGNLKIAYSGSNGSGVPLTSTFAVTQGKWYFEVKLTSTNDTGNAIGITDINAHSNAAANRLGLSTYSYAIDDSNGKIYNNNDSGTSYGSSYAAGDIIGVYLDLDNNKLYFSENGTLGSSTGHSITDPASVTNGYYFFAIGLNSGSGASTFECNFGGTQTYSISSGVSDDNGYGNFEYSPNITGDGAAKKFYALNSKNLAEFG